MRETYANPIVTKEGKRRDIDGNNKATSSEAYFYHRDMGRPTRLGRLIDII